MSHSKRNTSRAVFTSYERSLAKAAWGASSARLTRDSFLPFASCSLCLESAVDPVACPMGDIFCRECAFSNILAQKKEIKRLEKARERDEKEAAELKALQDSEAHERAVREFELVQAGFDVTNPKRDGRAATGTLATIAPAANNGPPSASKETGRSQHQQQQQPRQQQPLLEWRDNTDDKGQGKGTEPKNQKRKFELDEEELARIAAEDRQKARKTIEAEKSSRPALPSFWAPTVTPTSNQNNVLHEVKKSVKTQPVCPASSEDRPHTYSLHALVSVNFTTDDGGTQRICPSCTKGLTNPSGAMLAKPCGHVLCKNCVAQFMTPSGKVDPHAPELDPNAVRCYVCDADVTERREDEEEDKEKKKKRGKDKDKDRIKPGLVKLRSDGTGFSASGAHTVKKNTVAFQC